jgi:hypothetical protein
LSTPRVRRRALALHICALNVHVDAKRFDPSNRGDVPWPVDPVFGAGHQIVEMNGTESPVGWFDPAPNGEFKHPPEPRSAPWDRVLSWSQRRVLLGPGDYVVANLQWLVGDAREYKVYPKIMLLTHGTVAKTRLLDTTAAQPGWVERAKKEVAQRGLSAIHAVDVVAHTDRAAMLEFYTPVRRTPELARPGALTHSCSTSRTARTRSRRAGSAGARRCTTRTSRASCPSCWRASSSTSSTSHRTCRRR